MAQKKKLWHLGCRMMVQRGYATAYGILIAGVLHWEGGFRDFDHACKIEFIAIRSGIGVALVSHYFPSGYGLNLKKQLLNG